jgi:hypothetical protein
MRFSVWSCGAVDGRVVSGVTIACLDSNCALLDVVPLLGHRADFSNQSLRPKTPNMHQRFDVKLLEARRALPWDPSSSSFGMLWDTCRCSYKHTHNEEHVAAILKIDFLHATSVSSVLREVTIMQLHVSQARGTT